MGDVHRLIIQRGLEQARLMVETKADRQALEAAAAIMAEEASRIGITHAGFAMTSLPHRRIDNSVWHRRGHLTTLLVESGRDSRGDFVGVPFGSVARMILLYLQTEAIRTGSQEVDLGPSMYAWMGKLGVPTGGRNYKLVSAQAARLSACRLTFFTDLGDGAEARRNGAFVQDAISLNAVGERQGSSAGATVAMARHLSVMAPAVALPLMTGPRIRQNNELRLPSISDRLPNPGISLLALP